MALATQSNRIKIGIRPTIDGRRMGFENLLKPKQYVWLNLLLNYYKHIFVIQMVLSLNV